MFEEKGLLLVKKFHLGAQCLVKTIIAGFPNPYLFFNNNHYNIIT